jgi:hypothetical protein
VIAVRLTAGGPRRVVGVGDSVPGGERITSLSLLPVVSIGAGGDVSFAVAPTTTGLGPEGLFLAAAAEP